MGNISRAERHNRMLNKTFDFYHNHQNSLPSCHLYGRYLEIAKEKLSISIEDAMQKAKDAVSGVYGSSMLKKFTFKQPEKF